MKKVLLGALLALGTYSGWSQELPNIVPPSPEAAALGTFTEVPVSHYTGLPNISVPIYTIQEGGVSIPISLSYHARGVQVSQTAPRTGMGWSLSYGGSLSRQTRGKADESAVNGYLLNRLDFLNFSSDLNTRASVDTKEDSDPSYDFYPDQFNFSAGSAGGKFILDYDTAQPLLQSFGDVTITYTREFGTTGRIDAFVVIDAQGNTYYFGKSKDNQRTAQDYQDSNGYTVDYFGNQVQTGGGGSFSAYSAWKLMDIETVNGDLISYHYDLETSGAIYWRKSYDKHASGGPGITNSVANIDKIESISTSVSKTYNYEKHLSKIVFSEGRDSIVFKAQTARQDFAGKSLDRIEIYGDGALTKAFNLNYSYTESLDETNMLAHFNKSNGSFSQYFFRMFLASVEEEGSNGAKLPPYEFTYDSQVLPSMFSSRQDYWGYYNGATDNGPFTRIYEYGNYTPDRRVDTLKSEAGILKEIKYPTGGKTRLTYEHNRGSVPADFSSLKIPSINPGSQDEVTIDLDKTDFPYNSGTQSYTPYSVTLPYETRVTFNIGCMSLSHVNNPLPPDVTCLFYFLLDGNQVAIGEDFVFTTGNQQTYSGSSTIQVIPISHPQVSSTLHLDPLQTFDISISYDLPDIRANLFGPGKRIKRIENISQAGDTITKEFEYVFPLDTIYGGASNNPSGSIIGLPAYINTTASNANGLSTMTHYNDATSAYGNYQPNSIGYSSVIEYYGTKENNIGKTEYTFTNMMDSGGDYWEFPYHPPTDNEWLRGKPIRTRIFKKEENGDYGLVKEVYNKYLYGNNEYTADYELPGFRDLNFVFTPEGTEHGWYTNITDSIQKTRTNYKLPMFMRSSIISTGGDPLNSTTWRYRIYHLTGGTQHLLRTTEKNYNDAGVIESITTRSYNYDKHYQVKSTSVTDSRGDTIETINYYPAEVLLVSDLGYENITTSELSAIVQMQVPDTNNPTKTHQLATPIQVETKKNNVVQSVVRTNFNIESSGLVLPKGVETAKGMGTLQDRIQYHEYYANGNVKEVSKTDGTHIVYIWGYDQTVPVAKIENATASQVDSYISGIQNASNNDNDRTEGTAGNEGALRTALANLRSALPNAQMTSFTYDPLIGVTSITDPRGRTIYYHYDSFNRLQFVKDHDGNVVSKTEYNYKN